MGDEIDKELLAVNNRVRQLEHDREAAMQRRAMAFALANERGRTSGDIARLTGIPPWAALTAIRTGHQLIRRRRTASERQAAA